MSPKVEGKWWRAGHPPNQKVQEMFDKATVKGIESIPWTMKKMPRHWRFNGQYCPISHE
jgi:hypothetical protein